MNVLTTAVRQHPRRAIVAGIALAISLAALSAALSNPSTASACAPITNCLPSATYSFTSQMSAAQQSATGIPGDGSATGTSYITAYSKTNKICATTYWYNVSSPVMMGHIHGGAAGKPENPAVTIDLFPAATSFAGKTSPASGCAIVPGHVIQQIARCPAQFSTVVHSQKHPWGAIRGQLGTTCTLP
ncbi:MAG TPA: CHRD domain-containing protein [Thermoleophilaceae bacterium]|jgi:hypothetical protein